MSASALLKYGELLLAIETFLLKVDMAVSNLGHMTVAAPKTISKGHFTVIEN